MNAQQQKRIMTNKLQTQLTPSSLKSLAGERGYARGVEYFECDAVTELKHTKTAIKAIVTGTYDYYVSLRAIGKRLDYDCDCPVGADGECCKHVVAAGLAWLAQVGSTTKIKSKTKTDKKTDPLTPIRNYLANTSKAKLINVIAEQAENDPGLCNQLQARALSSQTVTNIDAHKTFIRNAIQTRGFIDHHGMHRYIQTAESVVTLLEELMRDGYAAQVAELAAYGLLLGYTAYQNVDDSAGNLGDILRAIAALHFNACLQAQPDPKHLANSLFKLEMKDDWGLVQFEQYETLLGKAGLKQFKQLAQVQWQKVPSSKIKTDFGSGVNEHFGITRLMERIAKLEGDIDGLVAIKKRDLSCAYHYYAIADIYAEAKRDDEALQWAQQGHTIFEKNPDSRLTGFLIAAYQHRQQHDQAIQLAWQQFTQQPSLAHYQLLQSCADKAGAWEFWRTKTGQWLRKDYLAPLKNNKNSRWGWGHQGHSLLVEILLWEKDIGGALQEATQGGCTEQLWLQLANAGEATHPDEALKIYQDRIGGIIGQTNNHAYDHAATLLTKIKKLMRELKQTPQFEYYVAQLRKDHKQKRNFIKKIEKI